MKQHAITFIGSGNLAWHLAPALDNAGYSVREVFSRKEENAKALAEKLYQCEVASSLDFSESVSRVFILAVPDDVIRETANELVLPPDAMLIHTSGSRPLSVLEDAAAELKGVMYPLQTFTKTRQVNLEDVPFFIEGDEEIATKVLTGIAKALSKKVVSLSSEERRALHIAAVFASNFTNHMLTISREIMNAQKLNFDLLKPLIVETMNKSLALGPHKSQTGPARRGDLEVLDLHMEFLKEDAAVSEIYKNISQHIIDSY